MLEYGDAEDCLQLEFTWHGEDFDSLAIGDELSITLIRGTAKSVTHTPNKVEIALWGWVGSHAPLTRLPT